jgi:hypothetical protein
MATTTTKSATNNNDTQTCLIGYHVSPDGCLARWVTPHRHALTSVACALGMDFQHDVVQNIHGDTLEIYHGWTGERNIRVGYKTGRTYYGPVIILRRSPALPEKGIFKSFVSFPETNGEDFEHHMKFDLMHIDAAHAFMVKPGEIAAPVIPIPYQYR